MTTDTGRAAGSVPEPRAASEPGPTRGGPVRAVAARFRPPAPGDPEPDPRRLAIVSVWAAALGFGGAIVAVHLLINLFRSDGGWYRPTIMAIGAIGLLATIGAFGSMHHRRLPWIMLGLGTAALMAAFTVTAAA